MNKNLVFVYGTLMKKMGNNRFLRNATFIGSARTHDKYTMYIADYILPKVTPEPSYYIFGELYQVSDEDMIFINKLEKKYTKKLIKVITEHSGDVYNAYIYLWKSVISPENHEKLLNGDYKKFIED